MTRQIGEVESVRLCVLKLAQRKTADTIFGAVCKSVCWLNLPLRPKSSMMTALVWSLIIECHQPVRQKSVESESKGIVFLSNLSAHGLAYPRGHFERLTSSELLSTGRTLCRIVINRPAKVTGLTQADTLYQYKRINISKPQLVLVLFRRLFSRTGRF